MPEGYRPSPSEMGLKSEKKKGFKIPFSKELKALVVAIGVALGSEARGADTDSMIYISPEVAQILKDKGVDVTTADPDELKAQVDQAQHSIDLKNQADKAQAALDAALAKDHPQNEKKVE